MCSISCLRLTLLILAIEVARGYKITSNTTLDEFPVQVPNFKNGRSFFRIYNHTEKKEIRCPWGYFFDKKQNHCMTLFSEHNSEIVNGKCLNLGLPPGDHSNPDSCQTFYQCDTQCCYLMRCSAHLLFNENRDQCLYPYEAECCEYVEKNPDRLVQ